MSNQAKGVVVRHGVIHAAGSNNKSASTSHRRGSALGALLVSQPFGLLGAVILTNWFELSWIYSPFIFVACAVLAVFAIAAGTFVVSGFVDLFKRLISKT